MGPGSLGVTEVGAGGHFVGAAAADLEMLAGTGEEHQPEGACVHVGNLAGPGEEAECQKQPLVQVGIPEAVPDQWDEGSVAVAVSAAVVVVQEFGLGHERAFLAGS